jgi:hypothetical protein
MHKLLSILVLFFISTNIAFACKCNSGISQIDHFYGAEFVALIKVTGNELRPSEELSSDARQLLEGRGIVNEYIRVSFDAKEVFKGKNNPPAYLMEWIQGGGNCALGLKAGREYVVFLSKAFMGFVVDCSGTFVFINEKDENGEAIELKLLRDLAKSSD